ncbi:SPFH domain-containing protein [Streptomyces sp. 796.1]|uniref:SPFH domain-containing protein n=1 Tax=Streptomyces sp. 796.1 TaxID=3163029 RepID=UPI0039C993A7
MGSGAGTGLVPERDAAGGSVREGAVRTVAPGGRCDELPRERPARAVLPGWCALLVGSTALTCTGALLWGTGLLPGWATGAVRLPARPGATAPAWAWAILGPAGVLALFAFGGLTRGRVGSARVLSRCGRYRGTARRTGLMWINPLLLRRRVDIRLRHWRSEPIPVLDAHGVDLRAVVLVVWQVRDTARAVLAVDDHTTYLREQVEATLAGVLSRLPADAYGDLPNPPRDPAPRSAPTALRDADAVGEALTRVLAARCAPVGLTIFSVQPVSLRYAPGVAAAMRRGQLAALDAGHRDGVLAPVADAVDDTVRRRTSRGPVERADDARKALVKDLKAAFRLAPRGPAPHPPHPPHP